MRVPTPEFRDFIAALDTTLAVEYLPDQRHGLAYDALFDEHIRIFVARIGGSAIGCGGVAFFDGFGEVKRMYVREQARGRGVAQALLREIELRTLQSGRRVLRLETGERQLGAIRALHAIRSHIMRSLWTLHYA